MTTMRLIDADTAAAFAENCGATFVAERLRDDNAFPEVVVRCKDCKYNIGRLNLAEWKESSPANCKVCSRCGHNVSIVDAGLYCCNCGSKMYNIDEEVGKNLDKQY